MGGFLRIKPWTALLRPPADEAAERVIPGDGLQAEAASKEQESEQNR
jgi:hypothetical protein